MWYITNMRGDNMKIQLDCDMYIMSEMVDEYEVNSIYSNNGELIECYVANPYDGYMYH